MIKKSIFILTFLLAGFVGLGYGAPNISSVSGTVDDGNTITINGSDLGTKSGVAPVAYDNFDSHSNGASIDGLSPTVGSNWGTRFGGSSQITITNAVNPTNSTNSARVVWNENSGNTQAAMTQGLSGNDFIIFFKRRQDSSNAENITGMNHKAYYARNSVNGNGAGAGLLMVPFGNSVWAYYNNVASEKYFSPGVTWASSNNTWRYWLVYNKMNSSGGATDGIVKVWVDGTQQLNLSNYNQSPDTATFTEMQLGEMNQFKDTDGPTNNEMIVYYDSVYIDDDDDIVLVTDAETFSNSSVFEVCTPTVWGSTQIQCTFRQGEFSDGQIVYIHVFGDNELGDEDSGTSGNQGYQVTINATGDQTAPSLDSITPIDGATNQPTSLNIDVTISDNVSLDNSSFVAIQRIDSGSPSTVTGNFLKHSSSTTETVWRWTSASYSNDESIAINYIQDDNSANTMDLTRSFTITAAPAGSVFSSGLTGDADNYTERNSSQWSTTSESGNVIYEINTTDYSAATGTGLGEYAYYTSTSFGEFEISFDYRSNENLAVNTYPDCNILYAWIDDSNYRYAMFNGQNSETQIFDYSSQSRTALATYEPQVIADNNWHSATLRYQDGTVTLFEDGELLLSADHAEESGKVGFGGLNDSCSFDNVTITSLESTPSPTPSESPINSISINVRNDQTVSIGEIDNQNVIQIGGL